MEINKPKKEMKEGFTTGACSAAASKAAVRALILGKTLTEIETTLPNKRKVVFPLKRCDLFQLSESANGAAHPGYAVCSVVKDAGDDPDCTHGAELTAEVRLLHETMVIVKGGEGVATVTKGGLGLDVGTSAINPVPRKNIMEMVLEELRGSPYGGAEVIISVPQGREMAKKTMNERLGLAGGISILGTTGIVKPYSTAAYRASVVQSITMAKENGFHELVFTTGGKSEKFAMNLFPNLGEMAFIQVGDFIGTGIKSAVKNKVEHVIIVGMMGKLSKMADGFMMTHRAGSEVNMKMLAEIARELKIPESVCETIEKANTARQVLEICSSAGFPQMTSAVCQRVVAACRKHAASDLRVSCYLVDFEGVLLGEYAMKGMCVK